MVEVRVPDEQEGTKAVVRGWLKKLGDPVQENDPLVELETDKVTQEVSAPVAGILAEIILETDAEAVPGALLARIDPSGKGSSELGSARLAGEDRATAGTSAIEPGPKSQFSQEQEMRLSPSVRRACLQNGIDPSRIEGSGRNGRVTREDIDRAIALATLVTSRDKSQVPQDLGFNDIPHDRMRLKIAQNMARAVAEQPHVTAVFEADFSAIRAHKFALAARGVKLSYTAYLIKAAADAMAAAPAINGRWEEDRIAIGSAVNIGVGTALGEKGLVVPVVRDVAKLTLEEIGAKLEHLTRLAREGRLERSDVSGGTFTISNHGVSGSLLASPIILNQGQAAILGVGKLEKRVIVREIDGEDAIVIRPMAYVTLTIDHRVVDGHQTNAWLSHFVETLEHWPRP